MKKALRRHKTRKKRRRRARYKPRKTRRKHRIRRRQKRKGGLPWHDTEPVEPEQEFVGTGGSSRAAYLIKMKKWRKQHREWQRRAAARIPTTNPLVRASRWLVHGDPDRSIRSHMGWRPALGPLPRPPIERDARWRAADARRRVYQNHRDQAYRARYMARRADEEAAERAERDAASARRRQLVEEAPARRRPKNARKKGGRPEQ